MRFPKSPDTGRRLFRTLAALVLLAAAACPAARAQSLRTLRAEFTRTTRSGDAVETIRGTLYYQAPDRLTLVIKEPVHQWVIFEEAGILFWYPDDAKAWRLADKQQSLLGMPSLFVAVPRADFGLAGAGFKIIDTEIRDSLLFTRWKPPASLRKTVDAVTTETREDLSSLLKILDRNGKAWAQLSYSYVSLGEVTLPERVVLKQFVGKAYVTEEIVYTGHEIDGELPPDIADFTLPTDLTPKEIKP